MFDEILFAVAHNDLDKGREFQYLDTLFEITTLQISVFCPFIIRIALLSRTSPRLVRFRIISLALFSMLLSTQQFKRFLHADSL